MGREIEMKIQLTDGEYDKVLSFVRGELALSGVERVAEEKPGYSHFLKSDEYYSRYKSREERKAAGEPQVIRIRCEVELSVDGDAAAGGNSCGYDDKTMNAAKVADGELSASKAYFCIKRKSIENGIELNREDETFVEEPDVVRDLLQLSGYHKFFEKKKDALSVYCQSVVLPGCNFHLELEQVNGLKYIEVEVTDGEGAADQVRLSLGKFMECFGLDPARRDSRSWMDILLGSVK